MERELKSVQVKLSPSGFVALCRCIMDDFEACYDQCKLEPYADNSDLLDRMEEDLDLLEAALPAIDSEETEFEIKKTIAGFKSKIAEVA